MAFLRQQNNSPVQKEEMAKAVSDILRRVLMVPPKHFCVKYAINPWMKGVVDKEVAQKEWDGLKNAIEAEGVEVLTMEPQPELPDIVFVCNSGLVLNNKVFLSRFRHEERRGETKHYIEWFQNHNIQIIGEENAEFFEGGGDAVFSDYGTLWAGFGARSTRKVYDSVRKLGDFEIVECELTHPNYYHLDTCFTPVGSRSALWYPPAFSQKTQKEIQNRLPEAIAVSDAEAEAFVCNAITVRNAVISPIGVAAKTKESLQRIGYRVVEVPMGEFMKSGGACQCLVLKL